MAARPSAADLPGQPTDVAATPTGAPAADGGRRKPPRRTAERILDVALGLFNRFGEPNVSTTLIATELGISPGNLYYHYPAKEEIVNGLFARHQKALAELLPAAGEVRHVEDAWLFLHMLFERLWATRFLLRDLNELMSRNRQLERRFQQSLADTTDAVCRLLDGLTLSGAMKLNPREAATTSTAMVVLLTYWLSYEYVRDPRRALEPEAAAASMGRGAQHVLGLLAPYLDTASRAHLLRLAEAYR